MDFTPLYGVMARRLRVLVIACVAFGMFLMWFVPLAWAWLRPVLHGLTA